MLAHQDEDGWGDLKFRDLVILNHLKHVFVDKSRHDVHWDVEFCRHDHGIQLTVGVIEWEEADPAFISGWVFAGAFELGFLGVLHQDCLFCVGDQVIVGLATLVRGSDTVRIGRPTIMTPLGRPVVPLE